MSVCGCVISSIIMEIGQKTPKIDTLRQMSYSELKKLAKKHGIKGNMKAEKIIAALSSVDSEEIECFSTPSQKEINSCRKNKEQKFNEDFMTPSDTPRRLTYSVETPPIEEKKCNDDNIVSVATSKTGTKAPAIKEEEGNGDNMTPKCKTISSTSAKVEDLSFTSTVFDSSALNISNVNFDRGSSRKSRLKVNFISPTEVQSTPKNPSIKLRPKTPIASRVSLAKQVSFSSPSTRQKRRTSSKPIRTTPYPKKSSEKSLHMAACSRNSFIEENSSLSISEINDAIPLSSVTEFPEKQDLNDNVSEKNMISSVVESSKKQYVTRSVKQSQMDDKKPSSMKMSGSKSVTKSEVSAKIKRAATPNFKKIHERAFEKMESIDDYQKCKQENSVKKIKHRPNLKSQISKAKSKIPAFSGIPFVPSVHRNICKTLDFDFKGTKVVVPTETKKVSESIQKNKNKFDLKASLSRKLSYRPYKGPVKPLAESNILNTMNASCVHKPKGPIDKAIKSNRLQSRSILKGVRSNKRFELQMKNQALK